jgi:uncharacterized protein (TIGR03084 family)
MPELRDVIADLNADGDEVDRLVADLGPADWKRPTPAPGWTIAHQIAHLAATFRIAGLAASDAVTFKAVAAQVGNDFGGAVDASLKPYLDNPPEVLLNQFRTELTTASKALAAVPANELVPWLVNPLPPHVLAGAGMMELFGHGQDIADTLGTSLPRTDRLGHIVGFAVHTWTFGYLARGLTPPAEPFRFEITSPSGQLWQFGPADATQRISGPAADLCLLVTRRRHHSDLSIVATGDKAGHWLEIAQAYRGPAGDGRKPGQFATTRG